MLKVNILTALIQSCLSEKACVISKLGCGARKLKKTETRYKKIV